MNIVQFPEVAIQLNLELRNHPRCQMMLASLPQHASLNERVAMIATYCGVIVDGEYGEDKLEGLFELLLKRMRELSTNVIETVQ